ncbi:hypothetical protein ACLQ26_26215 [Micromonospora sp. DT43]|uniref:hypothetical protein n=1 Tax=Micromonospora sp. DT43 TaxID=3393440 RepID=UPI003CF4C5F3
MSGITPYLRGEGNMADACRDAAVGISDQLDRLRAHLASLDLARLQMSAVRREALLTGYDIYVRMLDDALHDIAAGLQEEPDPRRSDTALVGGGPR